MHRVIKNTFEAVIEIGQSKLTGETALAPGLGNKLIFAVHFISPF
jgi:hypothetical protein